MFACNPFDPVDIDSKSKKIEAMRGATKRARGVNPLGKYEFSLIGTGPIAEFTATRNGNELNLQRIGDADNMVYWTYDHTKPHTKLMSWHDKLYYEKTGGYQYLVMNITPTMWANNIWTLATDGRINIDFEFYDSDGIRIHFERWPDVVFGCDYGHTQREVRIPAARNFCNDTVKFRFSGGGGLWQGC